MKKILSVLLAMVMVIGFSPVALAADRNFDITSETTLNAQSDLVRTDTTTQTRTRTRTSDEARMNGRVRLVSQEDYDREEHIRQARTQADEQFAQACARYYETRERYAQARETYAQAVAQAEGDNARVDTNLRARLETTNNEYVRARDACETARGARERDVRETMVEAHAQTRDGFGAARELYAQARERYAQTEEAYAQVRLRVSEGERIDIGPARERYEQARDTLEQARVRYEAALNAETNVRIKESLMQRELAQERYEDIRTRYDDARSRAQLGLDVAANAQTRTEYEQARTMRERAMHESTNERRAVSQERYEDARSRYEDARTRVANTRERLTDCERVGLCEEEREDLRRDARPFLTAGADVVIEAIEQTIIRIEASNMPEEQKRERIAALQARIAGVLEARAQAANIDERADIEHVQQASGELRREWVEARKEVQVSQGIEVNARLKHVHEQLRLLGERLEQTVNRLEAQGHDVSAAAELIAEYDTRLEVAHNNYEAAVHAYTQARAAGDFDVAAQEANRYVRQAHAELRQARELLREIIQTIRVVDPQVDLSAQVEDEVQV